MAERNLVVVKPVWMKQAEEAKLKSEAETAAAAKAAFDATFKAVEKKADSSDSDGDEADDAANKPIGPLDPAKCTAAGIGIAGGTACSPSSFVVVTKDSDGRRIPHGGAEIKVRVSPGAGVGGSDQDGMVKDMGDGTYTVTYVVPKRGNYMVNVECNGKAMMGSPFPVFFSQGTTTGGLLGVAPAATYPTLINHTMPNMPNYTGSFSGVSTGLLGMIPGLVPGASGGVVLPGIGSSLGEVCREYLNGRCLKTDCKFNHPQNNLLMTALAATTSLGTLSQAPMAPSAAAMAAAQAIVAAQALQAHAAPVQTQILSVKDSSGSADKEKMADSLKKTLQVSNLSPLLTVDQLKQLFSFCGTVLECSITDSKHFAYIEYTKPEEATAALALNNMDVGGRPLNVEMAKSLPPKPSLLSAPLASSSLPLAMQQAVAMQQMQFQQALLMQQALTAQQAANRAATMKSAIELAAARAAEISKSLKANGPGDDVKDMDKKSRSPPSPHRRSKSRSKSRSPISYRRRHRSRSFSPHLRYSRHYRSRSPLRSRHYSRYEIDRRSYRDFRDDNERARKRDYGRSDERYSSGSRRYKSRSVSPSRKLTRDDSVSPKHRQGNSKHWTQKSSPRHHKGSRSSPRSEDDSKLRHRRHSRSKSPERRCRLHDKKEGIRDETSKHHHRRRSRSVSAEGEHRRGSRSSPRVSEDSKSKHRRRSRSKSPKGKSLPDDRKLRGKNEKLKHCDRQRSRSKSLEYEHNPKDKVERRRDEKSKHQDRRPSSSKSAENEHHLKSTIETGRGESSKHYHGRHFGSISAEDKPRRRTKMSPIHSEEQDLRKRLSRSQSVESVHYSEVVVRVLS